MPRRPATAPRRPPRQQRSQATVEVLLEATERVLVREGFARATTNKIAATAGVSVGTLYHYFPSLEGAIEAVVHRMWARELEVCVEQMGAPAGRALEDIIAAGVGALAAHVRDRQKLYARWYAEAPHLGQLGFGLELATEGIRHFTAVLKAHHTRLRHDDVDFAADFAIKILLAAVRTAARDFPSELASGQLARATTDLLVRWLVR